MYPRDLFELPCIRIRNVSVVENNRLYCIFVRTLPTASVCGNWSIYIVDVIMLNF